MAYQLAFSDFFLNGARRQMAYFNGTYNGGYQWINRNNVVGGFINITADKEEIINTGHKDYVMYNGNYIRVFNGNSSSPTTGYAARLGAELRNAQGAVIGGAGWDTGSSWYADWWVYLTLYKNTDDNKIYITGIFANKDSSQGYMTSSTGQDESYYENSPTYTWRPFAQLVGNNGQFRMNLSQIKQEYIGDGETEEVTQDRTHVIFSDQSKFANITANLLIGEETVVAYAGNNYMTATKTSDNQHAVFKLYLVRPAGDYLVYTSPQFLVSDTGGITTYLTFIIDDVHEVAAFDYMSISDTGYIHYNVYPLPDAIDLNDIYVWLSDNGSEQEETDPYDVGTTDNGCDPGLPRPQDHITDSTLPTTGGLNMSIVTLYHPTSTQLNLISQFLWSDNVLDNFKKYFNNFADNILNLYTLPFTPASLPTKAFKVGNLESEITGVEYCTVRFFDIDMGSVVVKQKWGSYLDYSPYSKAEIYLPYLGLHSLDIDEIMSPCKMDGSMPEEQGSTLSLVYRLDILTGVIVAKIKINGEIRYQFNGKVGATIPLTGQTFAQLVQGIITGSAGLITTVATSGMAAPMVAGAAAIAGTVQAQKASVERIGNISGDASMLATNVPYLILTTPNKPYLEKQQEFTGFPSYKSGLLSGFSGYTEVIDAHVEGISCTDQERAEILSILKSGVIL